MKPRFFTAKAVRHFLFLLAMALLVACRTAPESPLPRTVASPSTVSKAAATQTPRSPFLLTNFVSMDDAYGGVTISEESVEVRSKTIYEDGHSQVSTSIRWKPRKSWFVYVENEQRVWFFDGGTNLRMHQHLKKSETESTGAWYTAKNLPCAVPNEILNRLPDEVLQTLKVRL